MKIPTDRKLWKAIHDIYSKAYNINNPLNTKIFIKIDVDKIAKKLKVDGDIVFGRLYYHLDEKFRYQNSNESWVHLFAKELGGEKHCINFPLLNGVLASLEEESRKFNLATTIALGSFIISIISLIISLKQ